MVRMGRGGQGCYPPVKCECQKVMNKRYITGGGRKRNEGLLQVREDERKKKTSRSEISTALTRRETKSRS